MRAIASTLIVVGELPILVTIAAGRYADHLECQRGGDGALVLTECRGLSSAEMRTLAGWGNMGFGIILTAPLILIGIVLGAIGEVMRRRKR